MENKLQFAGVQLRFIVSSHEKPLHKYSSFNELSLQLTTETLQEVLVSTRQQHIREICLNRINARKKEVETFSILTKYDISLLEGEYNAEETVKHYDNTFRPPKS